MSFNEASENIMKGGTPSDLAISRRNVRNSSNNSELNVPLATDCCLVVLKAVRRQTFSLPCRTAIPRSETPSKGNLPAETAK